MGEPRIKKDLSIREASLEFNVSEAFITKYIRLGVLDVVHFNGKPLKPYRLVYTKLLSMFTVAALRSLKTEELGKVLSRKPSKKEELWQ